MQTFLPIRSLKTENHKFSRRAQNINHQTKVSAIKRPPQRRHLYIDRLSNFVSTDDKNYCMNTAADLLCIREISREDSHLKSFHCVFNFDNDLVESHNFWPKKVSFSRFF